MRRIGWKIGALMLIIGALGVRAQSGLIEIEARVDKNVITIGDRITYTITIRHAPNVRVENPGPGVNLGMFEIKDYQIHEPVETDGIIQETFEYVISVYDTGRFVIPPFPVAFFASDTTPHPQIITSDPVEIYVESVLKSADAELKDIKPPLTIPVDYRRWVMLGLIGLLAILLLGGGYYYYRKRQRGEPIFRKEVIQPAHEIAYSEIEQLLNSGLMSCGEWKTFFTLLSDILRRYVENRFFVPAMEDTTSELMYALREMNIETAALDNLEKTLELCDLVKFARYEPVAKEVDRAIQQARNFIEATKLEFQAVEVLEKVDAEIPENGRQAAPKTSGKGNF
ncbi:MAG: protein BatD [Calditrichaeota bacterium]|nr:protein BatD [Calditrichota bacterium]